MKIKSFDKERLLVEESLFSVANGYIGIRGNFEEGYPEEVTSIRGSYINGVFEIVDLQYAENAFGFPQTAQKMLNIMDAQGITLYFDEERFSLFEGTVVNYERELDLEKGFSKRTVHWRSPSGLELIIVIKKMASFIDQELLIWNYDIKSINFNGKIRIESTIEGDVENYTGKDAIHDPRVNAGHGKFLTVTQNRHDTFPYESGVWEFGLQTLKAERSGIEITAAMCHTLPMQYVAEGTTITATYADQILENQSVQFSKIVSFSDTRRTQDPEGLCRKLIEKALKIGVVHYFEMQKQYFDTFWDTSMITIDSDDNTQEAVQYNIYQLHASAGRDGISNVSAKGLSGEGYEGHYFWDTEIYMLPFFSMTQPEIAKKLLLYRYSILDHARQRAIDLGHKKGAKIPWRTINGDECSGYFPAGCAQYHINADVAYALIQYYLVTKDESFMREKGFELLVETARIWIDMGHYDHGQFRIDAVTGPDEYTAIVNNNYYTNSLAKYHLYHVAQLYHQFKTEKSEVFTQLLKRLGVTDNEIDAMSKASEAMYLPFDETLQISLQDDSFIHKKEWDFENQPKDKHPLLLHYHPLTIYRHKVLKQADTILAHFLLDTEKDEIIKNSYDYYEARTTHDSSLSPCVHGIMAARTKHVEEAYRFFMKTLRLDLDNLHHNTKDGLHIANLGGVYMSMVYGFGGLRVKEKGIHISPQIPKEWKSYAFTLLVEGAKVRISVNQKGIELWAEKEMQLYLFDHMLTVNQETCTIYIS